jgi:hypothetical protein
MIIQFAYRLNDRLTGDELREELERVTGESIDTALMEKIGTPFHEVELQCTLDLDTGQVEIVTARSA